MYVTDSLLSTVRLDQAHIYVELFFSHTVRFKKILVRKTNYEQKCELYFDGSEHPIGLGYF